MPSCTVVIGDGRNPIALCLLVLSVLGQKSGRPGRAPSLASLGLVTNVDDVAVAETGAVPDAVAAADEARIHRRAAVVGHLRFDRADGDRHGGSR